MISVLRAPARLAAEENGTGLYQSFHRNGEQPAFSSPTIAGSKVVSSCLAFARWPQAGRRVKRSSSPIREDQIH
jgi:hypothetical protein